MMLGNPCLPCCGGGSWYCCADVSCLGSPYSTIGSVIVNINASDYVQQYRFVDSNSVLWHVLRGGKAGAFNGSHTLARSNDSPWVWRTNLPSLGGNCRNSLSLTLSQNGTAALGISYGTAITYSSQQEFFGFFTSIDWLFCSDFQDPPASSNPAFYTRYYGELQTVLFSGDINNCGKIEFPSIPASGVFGLLSTPLANDIQSNRTIIFESGSPIFQIQSVAVVA